MNLSARPVPCLAGRAKKEMVTVMFWYGAHWMFWQAAVMWGGMVVFWGLVIWAVYALVTSSRRSSDRPGREDLPRRDEDPRRILDQRLARGEIDAEEYQRLRDLIDRSPADAASR